MSAWTPFGTFIPTPNPSSPARTQPFTWETIFGPATVIPITRTPLYSTPPPTPVVTRRTATPVSGGNTIVANDGLYDNPVRLIIRQIPNKPAWEHFGFDLSKPTDPRDQGVTFRLPFLTNKFRAWVAIAAPQGVAFSHSDSARLHIELFNDANPQDVIQIPFTLQEVVGLSSAPAGPHSRTLTRTLPYTYWNGAAWVTTNLRYSWACFAAADRNSTFLQPDNVMVFSISDSGAAAAESKYLVRSIPVDVEMFVNSGRFRLDPWANAIAPFEALPEYWCMGSILFYCEDR
jgi:hypothetical protein